MIPDAALSLVQNCLKLLGDQRYDEALALFTADCEYDNVPIGKVTGPEAVRQVLTNFFAPTLENEFIFKTNLVQGETVIIERVDRHRLPTGWVELPVMGLFVVRDGKIAVWRDYFDVPTLMKHWPNG